MAAARQSNGIRKLIRVVDHRGGCMAAEAVLGWRNEVQDGRTVRYPA